MRTLKSKIILPVAVFIVAIATAFTTQAKDGKDLAWEQGYIHTTTTCEVASQCSTTGNKVCRVDTQQLFGMNAASQCIKTLYLPIQGK